MRREYSRGGPTAKAFVTGDHGALKTRYGDDEEN